MSVSEFELIRRFFFDATTARDDVVLGIGDDCALLQVPPGQTLAVSIDTLVAGRHFRPDIAPDALGHKALAVNLSDLAAMGAKPAWATLALTLPDADLDWLGHFMRGFSTLAARFDVELVGGDTTRGPLSITIQVHGLLPDGQGLRRDGARAGDRVLVSGTLGEAALALRELQTGPAEAALLERLERPEPRVDLGILLRDWATAAIDVSDGLLSDLGHICDASGLGARIELARLPLTTRVKAQCSTGNWQLPLDGGDDYELVFTVASEQAVPFGKACAAAGHAAYVIGELVPTPGITLIHPDGRQSRGEAHGFDHFRR